MKADKGHPKRRVLSLCLIRFDGVRTLKLSGTMLSTRITKRMQDFSSSSVSYSGVS